MKVLVTGGAGFIGSHLIEGLLDQGYQVRVLDDFSTGKKENLAHLLDKIEFIQGSLVDVDVIDQVVNGVNGIFHLGAIPSVLRSVEDPLSTHSVNVGGTLKLLMAAKKYNIKRLVLASSSSVYGDTPVLPKVETMSLAPLSPYAASKTIGEYYCWTFQRVMDMDTVCLRFFNVYGPRQDPKSLYAAVVPNFISSYLKGEVPRIYGDGEQSRDFTFVKDVVKTLILAFESSAAIKGESINVAGGKAYSVNLLAQRIREILKRDLLPIHEDPKPGDVLHSQGDPEKCKQLIGYFPDTPLEEGLRKTIAWFSSRSGK